MMNTSHPGNQIETTVEVAYEMPEAIKQELKKRRKKFKQKSAMPSLAETSFDLEAIEHDTEDSTSLINKESPQALPRILTNNGQRPLPDFPSFYHNEGNEEEQKSELARPVPPPRRNKTTQESEDILNTNLSGNDSTTIQEESEQPRPKPRNLKKKQTGKKKQREQVVRQETEDTADISAYDFFTRIWDDTEPVPQKSTTESQIGSAEETTVKESPSEDSDSANLLRKELQEKVSGFYITKHESASYVPFQIKIEKEKTSFFHPSFKPVPVELKIPEGKEPRNLADEGFYVGKRPQACKRNINRLENRLLTQKELQWFGEDGLVKMLPDPVCESPVRWLFHQRSDSFPELTYMKAKVASDASKLSTEGGKIYELNLDISSISFTHHPLFSREHVIESRLLQMYEKYLSNEKTGLVTTLKQKLKVLRAAAGNIKQNMKMGMQETSINNERLARLKTYQNEIRKTKRIRDLREAEEQALWKGIISTWNELKTCRQNQGYVSTPLHLTIHEESVDEAAEKEEWERELFDELEEEMEDYESQYDKLTKEYEAAMSQWKQWNKAKKQAEKRQKVREKIRKGSQDDTESEMGSELLSTETDDQKILSGEEMPKPKSVPKFNSETALEKMRANALKMRKHPGDPKLRIKLEQNVSITPINQCPRDEAQRRNDVSKSKLYFAIMFNDKKVSETCERSLNQDFRAFWGQIFKIHIVHYPQSLRIEVYESGWIYGTLLAELYIPIPASSQTTSNASLVDHQFSTDKVVAPKNNCVGSGVSYKFASGDETCLLTSGNLKCSFVWGVSDDGTVMVPPLMDSPTKGIRSLAKLSNLAHGFASIDKLYQWIQKSNLDPKNPENAELFQLLHEYGLDDGTYESEESGDYYRLEPFQEEFDFCTMEEIENNRRFQLLQLRNRDSSEYRDIKMIPADEKDIKPDFIENLKKKKEAEKTVKKSGEEEAPRDQAKKLMQKVREEVAKRFYVSQNQKMFEDVVYEEKVPNIGTIGFSLLKLLQTKRPLYPVRKDRKKVAGQSVVNTDVKIIIRILHASNVPVRVDVDPVKERLKQKFPEQTETSVEFESQVQPFVEVMFQRVSVKTGVADGPHPTWNQELHLPFRAPNDNYSPASLESVKDVIYFNIFDEVTVDLLEDEMERESVVHERLERRWLGNLKIPFTTLYLNSKIEGTFRINVPPVLLSYENEARPWLTGRSDTSTSHTYLSFFMTIEPCLQLPEVFRDKCDSGEPEKLLHEVEKWHQVLIPHYPDRSIKLMAVDLSGKWIFVSRFLRPLSPPEALMLANSDSMEQMELLARFVSLIPTISDSIAFPGLCDIWSTSDQFLQMLSGDEEEHAILLCNYFLHLGKKSMLLIGSGIPEGLTAYVITWESNNNVVVWNSSTGDHFDVRDSYNPLHSVGCVISDDNLWINIQKSNHPSRINYDLTKTGEWKPFFSRSFPNPGLRSIQPSSLTYCPTDTEYVQKLQEKIKTSLQESIMKWRRKQCTTWNSYCNQVLYKILTRLERNAGRTASVDSLQELEQILSSHKMNGFPLTMPFTDIEDIIEAVYATGVHLIEDKNAEFSLDVYIHPYPCSVLAVWIYVAVLVSRRIPDEN